MNLTPAQVTTLRNFINADPTLGPQLATPGGPATVASALNLPASGPFVVWRTDIKPVEVVNAIVGAEFVALTAIKQTGLTLLLMPGIIDASAVNVRNDFSSIFAAGTTLTALTALSKRNATVVEKVFATGTGTSASPATLVFQGPLDFVPPAASPWSVNLTNVVKSTVNGNMEATVVFTNSSTSETFTRVIPGNDLTRERLAAICGVIIRAQGDSRDAAFPTLTLGPITPT